MERITNGKYVTKGYKYLQWEIRNHGYYHPDHCIWWEAIDIYTGCADFHAKTKKMIKALIDESVGNRIARSEEAKGNNNAKI